MHLSEIVEDAQFALLHISSAVSLFFYRFALTDRRSLWGFDLSASARLALNPFLQLLFFTLKHY